MSEQRGLQAKVTLKGKATWKGIAIDAVIFGFHENQLKVLLIEYKRTGLFALPGGFIREMEKY